MESERRSKSCRSDHIFTRIFSASDRLPTPQPQLQRPLPTSRPSHGPNRVLRLDQADKTPSFSPKWRPNARSTTRRPYDEDPVRLQPGWRRSPECARLRRIWCSRSSAPFLLEPSPMQRPPGARQYHAERRTARGALLDRASSTDGGRRNAGSAFHPGAYWRWDTIQPERMLSLSIMFVVPMHGDGVFAWICERGAFACPGSLRR